eukprot:15365120-Ditylum_brightwellii.AAC.2
MTKTPTSSKSIPAAGAAVLQHRLTAASNAVVLAEIAIQSALESTNSAIPSLSSFQIMDHNHDLCPFQIKSLYGGSNLTEATGWAMDSAVRGPLNQAGSFAGTALLHIALAETGCKYPRTCTT